MALLTRDEDGWLILLDLDLGRRAVLDVRVKRWALVYAGILGPLVFHGRAQVDVHK